MLAVDPFGASDSRNNLLSAYKQIYKRAYLSGDMRVVNFIDGFFFRRGLSACAGPFTLVTATESPSSAAQRLLIRQQWLEPPYEMIRVAGESEQKWTRELLTGLSVHCCQNFLEGHSIDLVGCLLRRVAVGIFPE